MNDCEYPIKVKGLPIERENTLYKLCENAYFTLEACMIMPLVFMVILFIMYTGFFFYNKCLLKQDTYRLLLRAGQIKNASNEEIAEEIRQMDSNWYYDKYVMCKIGDKYIEVNHDNLVIKQSATLNVNIPLLEKWFGADVWELGTTVEVKRICPTGIIRSRRKLEKLIQKENEQCATGNM